MRNERFRRISAIGLLLLSASACTAGSSDGHVSPPPSSTPAPLTPVTPSLTPATSSVTPKPTPTTVPTTGPNVNPGEKPPVLDPIGRTNSPLGADVFARYWFAALDWGYATTSSVLARQLFLPSCDNCSEFMKNFDEARAQGLHFHGGRVVVTSTLLVDDDPSYQANAVDDVTIAVGALQTRDGSGSIVATAPAIPSITYRIWLRWTGSGWAVRESKRVIRQ